MSFLSNYIFFLNLGGSELCASRLVPYLGETDLMKCNQALNEIYSLLQDSMSLFLQFSLQIN